MCRRGPHNKSSIIYATFYKCCKCTILNSFHDCHCYLLTTLLFLTTELLLLFLLLSLLITRLPLSLLLTFFSSPTWVELQSASKYFTLRINLTNSELIQCAVIVSRSCTPQAIFVMHGKSNYTSVSLRSLIARSTPIQTLSSVRQLKLGGSCDRTC